MAEKNNNLQTDFIPVVTLLGHVDHGKTSLLDKIRSTNIVAKEFGGITQHIGAYQIVHKGRKITFVDTPGHAAFEKMRSRGADICDISILIVAADDGIKPQTQEAIKHIKNAKVPMIVAVNKIDLPNIDLTKIKNQLQKEEVNLEEFGGNVPLVLVSAKTSEGIDELLDMIILVSDLEERTIKKDAPLKAIIIESYMDKSKGPVVNAIVKEGILKVGDEVSADGKTGKIRALISDQGKNICEAFPSTPVEILGFKKQIPVGSVINFSQNMKELIEAPEDIVPKSAISILAQREEVKGKFRIILKTDVSGSKEAILENLPEEVHMILAATGDVTDSDILLAKTSKSIIYVFGAKVKNNIQKQADQEGVIIKKFNIIYKFFEDLDEELEKYAEKKEDESIIGKAKIIAKFEIDAEKIAGCKVIDGNLIVGGKIRLMRSGDIVGQSKIKTIRQKQVSVQKIGKGVECGISFLPNLDFAIGDTLELFPL